MFIEQEDFLTDYECDRLIDIFHKESTRVEEYGCTNILYFDSMLLYQADDTIKDFLKSIRSKVEYHIKQFNFNAFSNYLQIVEWPVYSFQNLHYDFNYHCYTSIIYLNHTYDGGNTQVNDRLILPKKGKIITFNGNETIHGVMPVTRGTRYTVPVWYKCLSNLRNNC
jgi:hypothetical protein